MAQVTGLTAEKMFQLAAENIVDGEVIGDDLILTRRDGTQFNAGNVRGPSTAEAVEDTADTLVKRDSDGGVKAKRLRLTAGNDASASSTAHAIQIGEDNAGNLILDGNEIMARNNGVGAKVFIEYGTNTDPTKYTPTIDGDFTHKKYVDDLFKGSEIGSVDLNTLVTPGIYVQTDTSETSLVLNYPIALNGILEVQGNSGSRVFQTYTPHSTLLAGVMYKRVRDGSSWYPWQKYVAESDTGWINLTSYLASGWSGATEVPYGRILNKEVMFKGLITGTMPVATSTIVATLPEMFRNPTVRNNNIRPISNTGGFTGWCNVVPSTGAMTFHFKTPFAGASSSYDIGSISYRLD